MTLYFKQGFTFSFLVDRAFFSFIDNAASNLGRSCSPSTIDTSSWSIRSRLTTLHHDPYRFLSLPLAILIAQLRSLNRDFIHATKAHRHCKISISHIQTNHPSNPSDVYAAVISLYSSFQLNLIGEFTAGLISPRTFGSMMSWKVQN